MDWTAIVGYAFGALGLFDLGRLVFFKSSKKKASAEADSVAVDVLNNALEALDKRLEEYQNLAREKDAEITRLQKELADKRNENTTKGFYMCVHQACPLRRPTLGRGKQYYDEHRDEDMLGADMRTLEKLIAEYKGNGDV
ncbi:MAG: hypothetical protein II205_02025 [Bacteroidales bacterium]|nr:hypothetical protein [Bacteroidales bacterium]